MIQLPFSAKVALFLFSKGNEITDFWANQIEEIAAFGFQRYELGRAFVDRLIAEYDGSMGTLSVSGIKKIAIRLADDKDYRARVAQAGMADFGEELVRMAVSDPAGLRAIMDFYAPEAATTATGIPDDFARVQDVEAKTVGWHMADQVAWRKVWELTGGGENILGVVCDTGTTPNHPDIPEHAFIHSVVPGEPSGIDGNFHGTHCEGTFFGQNGIGAAPNCTPGHVQCLSAAGSGQTNWTAQAIHKALDEAIARGQNVVISLSIGGGGPNTATHGALLRAANLWKTHGLAAIVVAAAGNDGYQGRDTVGHPAANANAAAIAAYAASGLIAVFSSGGPAVDVAFPGVGIVSANFRGGRSTSNGTSMACPGAAGYAANQQSFRLKHGFALLRNTADFITHVATHATDAGEPGEDNRFGSGILEVFKTYEDMNPSDVTLLALGRDGKGATVYA